MCDCVSVCMCVCVYSELSISSLMQLGISLSYGSSIQD